MSTGPTADQDRPGFWFVYTWDWNAYPLAAYATEIEALRHAQRAGYGSVCFWPFGVEWHDVERGAAR